MPAAAAVEKELGLPQWLLSVPLQRLRESFAASTHTALFSLTKTTVVSKDPKCKQTPSRGTYTRT